MKNSPDCGKNIINQECLSIKYKNILTLFKIELYFFILRKNLKNLHFIMKVRNYEKIFLAIPTGTTALLSI